GLSPVLDGGRKLFKEGRGVKLGIVLRLRQDFGFVRVFVHYREIPSKRCRSEISESSQHERKTMPTIGTCKLCRQKEIELLESHFVSRKLYYSGKKKLEFVTFIDAGFDPEELKAHLLCRA